jgi:hypothetical protein
MGQEPARHLAGDGCQRPVGELPAVRAHGNLLGPPQALLEDPCGSEEIRGFHGGEWLAAEGRRRAGWAGRLWRARQLPLIRGGQPLNVWR